MLIARVSESCSAVNPGRTRQDAQGPDSFSNMLFRLNMLHPQVRVRPNLRRGLRASHSLARCWRSCHGESLRRSAKPSDSTKTTGTNHQPHPTNKNVTHRHPVAPDPSKHLVFPAPLVLHRVSGLFFPPWECLTYVFVPLTPKCHTQQDSTRQYSPTARRAAARHTACRELEAWAGRGRASFPA